MKCLAPVLLLAPLFAVADFTVSEQDGFLALDNGTGIRAVVAPQHGGELAGFEVMFEGGMHELIYRAGDYEKRPGWRGKAPLLFPAVGVSITLEEGKHHYLLDGTVYRMPFHGFARDKAWRVVGSETSDSHSQVTMEMEGVESVYGFYPFDFVLRVTYRLDAKRLSLVYTVSAAPGNDRPMPFAIGNHITFRSPLIEGPPAGSEHFCTDLPDLLVRADDGAFSGEIEASPYRDGWHAVSRLPHRSAVSLGGKPGAAELTLLDPSGLQLRLVHRASQEPAGPAIRFNLWADTEEGFFSPEPWIGTQNALNSGAGLVLLEPAESWSWTIDIIPSRAARPGDRAIEESP